MSTQEQVSIVKKALDISILISKTKEELNQYRMEKFRNRPAAPVREVVKANYPKIESTVEFFSPILLLTLVFLPFPIIYYLYIYKPKKKENIENIRNSSEYKQKCADIDEDVKRRQKEIDSAFEAATKKYNEITIPAYEKEKANWEEDLQNRISQAKSVLANSEQELAEHYNNNKIIPMQYRNIEALQYMYNTMSTSEYDIKDAIELYDKYRQRMLDEARLEEQKIANSLADEQNQLAYEQNELLDRSNAIADRARREAAVSNVVGTVQRHNTNKILKDRLGKR